MAEQNEQKSSVKKALHLLNSFSERRFFLTLEEIAEQSAVPKTTAFRLLAFLEEFGYIRKALKEGKTVYSLGYAFLAKGNMVSKHLDIRELARNEMQEVRDKSGLTVQLAIQDGTHALYVEQFESWSPVRVYPSIGRRVPLYSAACPRVLLAYLPETEQQKMIEQFDYQEFTSNTLRDSEVIKENLREIRDKGYSMSRGELLPGTVALAVPIVSPVTNEVLASLSVIGLDSHFTDHIEEYVQMLKESSKRISEKLIA